MTRISFSGMTLLELLFSVALLGMGLSMALLLFLSGKRYYAYGKMRVDSQTAARLAANRLTREIQESSRQGIQINASRDTLLLISARDSKGRFQVYAGPDKTFQGQPYWQKWVMYTLKKLSGNSYSSLLRKEGNPYGSPLPNPDIDAVAASIPNNWEPVFQTASVPARLVASAIKTFDVEDIQCGDSGNPLYVQIVAAKTFRGAETKYNPGDIVSFSCQGKTGCWIGVKARN